MPNNVTVFHSHHTELQIKSIVEDLDSLAVPKQTPDWGKYDGPYTLPWANGTNLDGGKGPDDFQFDSDVVNNMNASYSKDRFSSMVKVAETEAWLPSKSVLIPLHNNYQGYFFPRGGSTTDIVNKLLSEKGRTCQGSTTGYDLYFDDCGVNTSYISRMYNMEEVDDSSIAGICSPEDDEIIGPRGIAGAHYKMYPATRILYLIKNFKIFRNTTASGVKDPQPYQLSFYAKSNIPSKIEIAVTRTPDSAVAGSTSDLLHDGEIRYLNSRSMSYCNINSKWRFYWINFSLPTSLSSLTESNIYIHLWCLGSRSPVLLDISDVRLEQTQDLCGNKPNYLYHNTYNPIYQQLQLQLHKAATEYKETDYPSLILMRINRYSEHNRIKLILQGIVTDEVPTTGYDIFQYRTASDSTASSDSENIRSIVLLQKVNTTGSTYNVYSLTNKSPSYVLIGSVNLPTGSKITIGATDIDMKYTSIGIESVIACYDPDMIGKSDILKKNIHMIFSYGDLGIPKVMADDWSVEEKENLKNAWIIGNTNIEETDI